MVMASQAARPFSPDYEHSDRERWICIYPAYVNSKKSIAEGRKIPSNKAVENPNYTEIRDVCAAAGMILGVENKVYPREVDSRDKKARGRIRVQLRNNDGTPAIDAFPTRKSILLYIGESIPKLKARVQNSGASQGSSQQQQVASGGSKKPKGKGKKR